MSSTSELKEPRNTTNGNIRIASSTKRPGNLEHHAAAIRMHNIRDGMFSALTAKDTTTLLNSYSSATNSCRAFTLPKPRRSAPSIGQREQPFATSLKAAAVAAVAAELAAVEEARPSSPKKSCPSAPWPLSIRNCRSCRSSSRWSQTQSSGTTTTKR